MIIASGIFEGSYRAVPVALRFRRQRPRSQGRRQAIRAGRRALRRGRRAPGRAPAGGGGGAASGSLSISWSASSSAANRNWRASDKVPSPASASRLLASTRRAAACAGFPLRRRGRRPDRCGRRSSGRPSRPSGRGLADQLVELGDHFAHLAREAPRRGRVAACGSASARSIRCRARSARSSAAVEGRHRPSLTGYAKLHESRQALTLHGSPCKGRAFGPESWARRNPDRRSLMQPTQRRLANAIRALAMDAVEAANSGHPGMPMGMADAATALFTRHLKFDAERPALARPRPLRPVGRPRLDADLRLALPDRLRAADDRRHQALPPARQPVRRATPRISSLPGVEVTTGPLGQGVAMAVGMAIAERHLNAVYGDELVDHRTFVIAGDG